MEIMIDYKLSPAESDVIIERHRQIDIEGYTSTHDDRFSDKVLTDAAVCYIWEDPATWPWEIENWKPKNRRENLIRAAALIIAEIDRMDRKGME
jgi:hypothetical protein